MGQKGKENKLFIISDVSFHKYYFIVILMSMTLFPV